MSCYLHDFVLSFDIVMLNFKRISRLAKGVHVV